MTLRHGGASLVGEATARKEEREVTSITPFRLTFGLDASNNLCLGGEMYQDSSIRRLPRQLNPRFLVVLDRS